MIQPIHELLRRTWFHLPPRRILALLAAGFAVSLGACREPPSPPNVVFIAVDDLNDWVGPLGGHPQTRTPNLDRLAAEGVTFTHAYSVASACNPSRAATLTGLRPSTTGIYWNGQPLRLAVPEIITLPERLRAAGYVTAEAGKVLHDPDAPSWDERFPPAHDPEPDGRPINGIVSDRFFDWGPLDLPDSAMSDDHVVRWASEWIADHGEQPYFLAVGLSKPHLPWFVPREYFEGLDPETVELPEVPTDDLEDIPKRGRNIADPEGDHRAVLEAGAWGSGVVSYLAAIRFADTMVGRLLDAVDRSPGRDRTIIVLWSDHGFHLGEKMHWRKGSLWEEGTRVPLIVVAPGVTPAGAVCDRPVSLLDLYPTLLELLGVGAEEPLPGHPLEGNSLVPWLRDPKLGGGTPALSMIRRDFAVRSERWRYIRYGSGDEELYDLDADPEEWTNLADRPELAPIKSELGAEIPTERAEDAPFGKAPRPPEDGGATASGPEGEPR
ncbi:MAG: sulfatase [Acidobacteria bacterium]|nr:sulfatase [Acidobacteriota bacterium]